MQKTYSTKELANIVGVHANTLRFYEKIGFLTKPERKENGYRCYSQSYMERLNIIRTLRLANYSLSAILRFMKGFDSSSNESVESLLNNPAPDEDIVSVCDKLIHSLQGVAFDARKLTVMLNQMKKDFSTLQ